MTPCKPEALCWFGQRIQTRLEKAEKQYADKPTPGYRQLVDIYRRDLTRHIEKVCPSASCFWCEGTGGFGVGETGFKDCWSCKGTGEFRGRRSA